MRNVGRWLILSISQVGVTAAAGCSSDDAAVEPELDAADVAELADSADPDAGSPDASPDDAGDPDLDAASPDAAETDITTPDVNPDVPDPDAGPDFVPPPCTSEARYAFLVGLDGDVDDLTAALPETSDGFVGVETVGPGALLLCGRFASGFVVNGELGIVGARDADGAYLTTIDTSADREFGTPALILNPGARVTVQDVAFLSAGGNIVRAPTRGAIVLEQVDLAQAEGTTLSDPAVLFEDGIASARFVGVRLNTSGGLVESFGPGTVPSTIDLSGVEVAGSSNTTIVGSAFTLTIEGSSFAELGTVVRASRVDVSVDSSSFTNIVQAFDIGGTGNTFVASGLQVADSTLGNVAAGVVSLVDVEATGSTLPRFTGVDTFSGTGIVSTAAPAQALSVLDLTASATLNNSRFEGGVAAAGDGLIRIEARDGAPGAIDVRGLAVANVDGLGVILSAGSAGGAVYDSTFTSNRTGLLAVGLDTVENCGFSGHARTGLIFVTGDAEPATIRDSTFENNTSGALNGAGLRLDSAATTTVSGCTFNQNANEALGGAIAQEGAGGLEVVNSTFTGNGASCGGAISASSMRVTSSTFGDAADENLPSDFAACTTGSAVDLDGLIGDATCNAAGCTP